MKKTILAAALLALSAPAAAEFSSTWILNRVIVTDENRVFDSALDENILVGGVMKVVNDEYKLKGLLCDQRNDKCVKIVEKYHVTALDEEGLWAAIEDKEGDTIVHILARERDSYAPLNLMFTNTRFGATSTQSFSLTDHHEDGDFEFEEGVDMFEGKQILDQLRANERK